MKLKIETGDRKFKGLSVYDLVVYNDSSNFMIIYWVNNIKIMSR